MPPFFAGVRLRFEAESVEAAGSALRHLSHAARDAGFELIDGTVTAVPNDEQNPDGETPYGPPPIPSDK